ncbi:hypothetical protein D3C87_1634830 [compost metagenome]
MKGIDCSAIRCFKADSDPVADAGWSAVCRFQYEEGRGTLTPDRSILIQIRDAFEAECAEYIVVKTAGLLQIVGTDGDVSEDAHIDALLDTRMGIAIGPDAARLTMYAGAVLSVLKVNDGAYALAFMHQIEGLVDVFKPHGMGDEGA